MENASKALIIAGSVLLAILIVALGVRIFNKAESSVNTSSLDEQEIMMFNQKWLKYDGKQLGSNIKALVSSAIANANTQENDQYKLPTINLVYDEETTVANGGDTASAAISTYISSLNEMYKKVISTASYTTTYTYSGDGIINTITVTKN